MEEKLLDNGSESLGLRPDVGTDTVRTEWVSTLKRILKKKKKKASSNSMKGDIPGTMPKKGEEKVQKKKH